MKKPNMFKIEKAIELVRIVKKMDVNDAKHNFTIEEAVQLTDLVHSLIESNDSRQVFALSKDVDGLFNNVDSRIATEFLDAIIKQSRHE